MRNKSELRPQESWRGRAGPRGKEQAFRGGLGWREAGVQINRGNRQGFTEEMTFEKYPKEVRE